MATLAGKKQKDYLSSVCHLLENMIEEEARKAQAKELYRVRNLYPGIFAIPGSPAWLY